MTARAQRRSAHEAIKAGEGHRLLGWNERPHDERDYQLEHFIYAHARMAAGLTPQSTISDLARFPLTEWHDIYAFWAWFKQHVLHPAPTPAPAPAPVPTPTPIAAPVPYSGGGVWWPKLHGISDQADTPECVGFTGLDWGNTTPVDDDWANAIGTEIYLACKVIDGEPGQMNGSNSRSLCKALQQRGRIGAYAFSGQASTGVSYITQHGPVGTGIPWDNNMFSVDAHGFIGVGGPEEGGHEIEIIGYDPAGYGSGKPAVLFPNHWTDNWGLKGFAYMHVDHWQSLLDRGGDVWAGLEKPL